jgi:hypothetical protein
MDLKLAVGDMGLLSLSNNVNGKMAEEMADINTINEPK